MSRSDKRERRQHFRGRARPGRRVELQYRLDSAATAELTRACTRNIGVGGAFIYTDAPPNPGTLLLVRLHIPTADRVIETRAEVRWSGRAGDNAADAMGMGVRFQPLDVDELLELSEYFASLTGTEP